MSRSAAVAKRVQYAALPYRLMGKSRTEVMLITSLGTRRWIIPKGWPWPDQHDHVAAAAEAREEAGVLGEPKAGSIGSYTYEKRRQSGPVPVRVAVYLLEVQEELETWPECERRQRAWFTLSEAAAAVREPELRDLLLQVKASAEG